MLRRYPARESFNRLGAPGFEDGVRLAILLPQAAALWTDGGDVVALASHHGHLGTVRTFSCAHIVGSLRAAIPLAGHRAALSLALEAELLSCRAPLELFLEVPGQLAPRRQQRVVTGCGMDVRSRHREVREDAISGRGVVLLFQHHSRGGDGNKPAERVQAFLDEQVQPAAVPHSAKLDLKVHGFCFLHNQIGFFGLRLTSSLDLSGRWEQARSRIGKT